jgi:hypothetical protein
MCRNRYCELIGRSHKSNNIFWTVIFESWTCIQGCHDPDCHGRGAPVPIRQDYLASIQEEHQTWRDEEFDKALMSLNLDDFSSGTVGISRGPSKKSTRSETGGEDASNGFDLAGSDFDPGSAFLSDEALLDAIEANPELFP